MATIAISSRVGKAGSTTEPALTPSQIPFCEQFDLTTRISAKALESADTTLIDSGELQKAVQASDSDLEDDSDDDLAPSASGRNQPDLYRNVLDKIRETLIQGGFSTTLLKDPSAPAPAPGAAGLAERHICRIGINSIASPSWRSKTPHVRHHLRHFSSYMLDFLTRQSYLTHITIWYRLIGLVQVFACVAWIVAVQFRRSCDYNPCSPLWNNRSKTCHRRIDHIALHPPTGATL